MRLVLLLSLLAVAFCVDEPAVPAATETTVDAATTETPPAAVETVATTADAAAATPEAGATTAATPEAGATTAAADAATENEQAVAVLSGDVVLYRAWDTKKKIHILTTDFEKVKASHIEKEGVVGYVANEEKYEELKAQCPDLVKMYIFILGTGTSYVDEDGTPKEGSEVFYCAPEEGYCGANFALERFMGKPGQNIWYPTSNLKSSEAKANKKSIYTKHKTMCYVWKQVQSTSNDKFKQVRDKVLAEKMTVKGCLKTNKPSVHKFALDKDNSHSITKEKCVYQIEAVATVMTPELQQKSAADCPDLVKMTVYSKKEGPTLISKDDPKDASFEKGPDFYCAPKRGYCGADKEISVFKSKYNDYYYPEDQGIEMQVRGGAWPNYPPKKESLCWAWTDVEFDPSY